MRIRLAFALPTFFIACVLDVTGAWSGETPGSGFALTIKPFIGEHCLRCHSAEKKKGKLDLSPLDDNMERHAVVWAKILDELSQHSMPPEDEKQPDRAARDRVIAWISSHLPASAQPSITRTLPRGGNLVSHEKLFSVSPSAATVTASNPRIWRLRPDAYVGLVRDLTRQKNGAITQPFTLIGDRGIKDYAGLYSIDESSTEILLRNAEMIVELQTAHEIKDGKIRGKNDTVGEFVKLMDLALEPDRKQIENAIQSECRMVVGRDASADELNRYMSLYDAATKNGGHIPAIKTVLQAIVLRSDALFRSEVGGPSPDGSGQWMLTPAELARAVSLALCDRRENGIIQAALKGELKTREQLAVHIRRILYDPKIEKPRVLKFFREYFDYDRAPDVFKDKPVDKIKHVPTVLVSDTDRLVLHIVESDKDVFKQLLTTTQSFVNFTTKKNKQTRTEDPAPMDIVPPPNPNSKNIPEWLAGVDKVYGFDAWPSPQPTQLPPDTRMGILMQPSWLAAYSTNFDNDPVRRGRFVRERLLGGTVPELPIGVVAQVPDEPHRTFRDRLTVTRVEQCWKCHKQMDELGLPFENFDHYGRFRKTETVRDVDATAKHIDKKGKALGPVTREVDLVTSGKIVASGDPALDGDVKDPREMLQKLAASTRVRQVFIRHVFRFFMGRNETLDDAKTLQDADRAYVESGGSFNTLIVSLLTSDAFIHRSPPKPIQGESK
ncbi:MAG: DUF1588 domain-containing protein [Planctomycetota bacterium]